MSKALPSSGSVRSNIDSGDRLDRTPWPSNDRRRKRRSGTSAEDETDRRKRRLMKRNDLKEGGRDEEQLAEWEEPRRKEKCKGNNSDIM